MLQILRKSEQELDADLMTEVAEMVASRPASEHERRKYLGRFVPLGFLALLAFLLVVFGGLRRHALVNDLVSVAIGFVVGWFSFLTIVLPAFYGLPRGTIHVLKEQLRAEALLVYIKAIIVSGIALASLWGIVTVAGIRDRVVSSGFVFGTCLGVVLGVRKAFSNEGRDALSADFADWLTKWRFRKQLDSDNQVLDAYSKLLTGRQEDVIIGVESELPFSKDRIEAALRRTKTHAVLAPAPLAATVEECLAILDTFVPDSEHEATAALFDRVLSTAQTGDRETLSALLLAAPERQRNAVRAAFDVLKTGRRR
jgi:hypothetical protein